MNLGAKNARGDMLIFIDGDDEVSSNFIEKVASCFRSPNVIGVRFGMIFHSQSNLWGYIQDAWRWIRWNKLVTRYIVAIKKQVYITLGGFNDKLTIEEDYDLNLKIIEYARRHGLSIASEPDAIYICVSEGNLSEIFKHAFKFGSRLINTLKIHPKYGLQFLFWYAFNACFPVGFILLFLSPCFIKIISLIYVILYGALWIIMISRALAKHAPYKFLCILLMPISQMIIRMGSLAGLFWALIKSP